jgi:hypothetical protein
MPDFERCIRSLELHLEKDPVKREFIRQYHKGLDRGRVECAIILSVIIVVAILIKTLG